MKENVLLLKSFDFSLLIISEYRSLYENRKEYVLSKQLLHSGTSIGANIEEACGAQSKRDFLNKVSISYKETRETRYWIRLLKHSGYLSETSANTLLNKAEELAKILSATIMTTKRNLGKI